MSFKRATGHNLHIPNFAPLRFPSVSVLERFLSVSTLLYLPLISALVFR